MAMMMVKPMMLMSMVMLMVIGNGSLDTDCDVVNDYIDGDVIW